MAFCSWQSIATIVTYFRFDTKLIVDRVELNRLDFPAITFCPYSTFLRKVVGSSPDIYQFAYVASQPAAFKMENAEKLCKYETNLTILTKSGSQVPSGFLTWTDFHKAVNHDSFNSVKSCKINGKVFDCTRSFLNKFTDMGRCFTFNQSPDIIGNYLGGSISAIYGTSVNDSSEIVIKGEGRKSGIKFEMSVNQPQYCIPAMFDFAGFYAFIHSNDAEPSMYVQKYVNLVPGFATDVSIRMKIVQRNTEHWPTDSCQKNLKLKWYPGSTEFKTKYLPRFNCYVEEVWRNCGCIPFYTPPKWGAVLGVYNSSLFCGFFFDKQECNRRIEIQCDKTRKCERSGMAQPCNEVYYTTKSSYQKYPSNNHFASLKRRHLLDSNTSLAEVRQNFLVANFFLDSLSYKSIVIDPGMSWLDLINKLGGAIGMSLGMSVLTCWEIIFGIAKALRSSSSKQIKLSQRASRNINVHQQYFP